MEGHLTGFLVGLAVLFAFYRTAKNVIADEESFTTLDQKRMRSKWHYRPSIIFIGLFVALVLMFVLYQLLMIVELLWIAR